MENKHREDSENKNGEATPETPQSTTRSDSDTYRRTVTGTPKSSENFDGTMQQTEEKDLEDRDNNDGDANTENNS